MSIEGLTITPYALTPASSTGQALTLSRETGEGTNETGSKRRPYDRQVSRVVFIGIIRAGCGWRPKV